MTSHEMTGRRVVDNRGDSVGKLTDVLVGGTIASQWGILTHGTLKAHHRVVPMSQVYESGADGDHLVINMEKDVVRHAPEASGAGEVTPDLERELLDYYGSAV
jgi:hypothetical protein